MRDKAISNAMRHPDKLGAGEKKRRKLSPKKRTHAVMNEFKRGTLRSGNGQHVKNPKQAVAIALSGSKRRK